MITYSTLTKRGKRKINEDAVGVKEAHDGIFCVLADGLGGHGAGDIASNLAVTTSLSIYEEGKIDFPEMLELCMNKAQESIIEEQQRNERPNEMKTTAVMLLIDGNKAQWVHIGDSRLYVFENGEFAKRTLDHSVPQMLALHGDISEEEIRHHEDRNRLTRAMGVEWERPMYVLSEPYDLTVPTVFLLCSDGFWELIKESEMVDLLRKCSKPDIWLAKMEKKILRNGKKTNMDNYSAIAVFV